MPKLECASIFVETKIIDWSIFAKHPRLYDVSFYSNHDFLCEPQEDIIKKLSAHGKQIKSFKKFTKSKFPSFSIEFIPELDIQNPAPQHSFRNQLLLN